MKSLCYPTTNVLTLQTIVARTSIMTNSTKTQTSMHFSPPLILSQPAISRTVTMMKKMRMPLKKTTTPTTKQTTKMMIMWMPYGNVWFFQRVGSGFLGSHYRLHLEIIQDCLLVFFAYHIVSYWLSLGCLGLNGMFSLVALFDLPQFTLGPTVSTSNYYYSLVMCWTWRIW